MKVEHVCYSDSCTDGSADKIKATNPWMKRKRNMARTTMRIDILRVGLFLKSK
jgi:hypothetical protein